jgi:hypothetical protein
VTFSHRSTPLHKAPLFQYHIGETEWSVWNTRLWTLTVIDAASVGDINQRVKLNALCYLCGTVMLLSLGIKSQTVGNNHSIISSLISSYIEFPHSDGCFNNSLA